MNHALSMTYSTNSLLNHFIVLRMVKMSIEHGICSIAALAFASYGALLVCEPSCDFEGGHEMGRVATEMAKQLGAIEVCQVMSFSDYFLLRAHPLRNPRCYLVYMQ